MKKITAISTAFLFGFFLISSAQERTQEERTQQSTQQMQEHQKKPVAVNNLPEDVSEAVQENYEGFRITEAFHVTNPQAQQGAERTERESEGLGGMFSSDDESEYYELTLAKGQETKTVKFNESGDELDKDKEEVAVNELPKDVSEAVKEDYEGFRITEAFHVHNAEAQQGAESTEGMFSSDNESEYYELTLSKGQETKTVKYNKSGDEMDKEKGKEKDKETERW